MKSSSLRLFLIFCTVVSAGRASAMSGGGGGGGWSLGLHVGLVNSSQDAINEIIKRANTSASGPVSTSALNSAYEVAPFLQYRFAGTIYAVQFRPSYYYQKQDGTGLDGSYDMSVTGWTLFPMLRLYPLENDLMKFYMQFGLGYGRVSGEINEGSTASTAFESGSFGTVVGLGAEFCFSPVHCLNLEGDYRYLNFERNIITKATGSPANLSSTNAKGNEVEMDGNDLSVRMGGLMFMAGYTMYF